MSLITGINRRRFLAASSTAALGAYAAQYVWGQTVLSSARYVVVDTKYGRVRGAQGDGLVRFRGIPYGGSVSGQNRFKAAPPPSPWPGVRDALEFGAPSMQPGPQRRNEPPDAEDCLFLNVWTPAADGRKRPVMLYSHGGGFTTGSGGAAYQDGSNLARTWDVVVVASNHRLGLLGYLYLGHLGGAEYATSGNQGIEDIRDGLRWIHDNIERFGGDPNNVMIFGESGGGGKTSTLYAMPSAAEYFNKASIESGPGLRLKPLEAAVQTTDLVLKQLGLQASQWRQLLEVPAEKLVQLQGSLGRGARGGRRGGGGAFMGPANYDGAIYGFTWSGAGGSFGPTLDGHVMTHDPFYPTAAAISKGKPLMVGYNHDEMNFFFAQGGAASVYSMTGATLKQRLDAQFGSNADRILAAYKKSRPNASAPDLYVAISTAQFDVIGSTLIAERKYEQHGAPAYMYCFAHESQRLIPGTNHIYGAAHAGEIVYKFDNVPSPQTGEAGQRNPATNTFGDASASSLACAHNMSQMWSSFARTGRPMADGQPAWTPYSVPQRASMFIDAQCKVEDDPGRLEREVWEAIIPGDKIVPA